MEDFLYLIIGWSITSILVNGTIFDGLRVYLLIKSPILHKLFSCMQCSGFWVGVVLGIFSNLRLIYHPLGNLFFGGEFFSYYLLSTLAYGFMVSGISVLLNSLIVFFLSAGKNS